MPTSRSFTDYLLIALKGVGMGSAEIVPGVSGGTIAFITGIYEELLDSIKSVNLATLKTLFRGDLKGFWQAINGNFLLALLSGMVLAFASLVQLITYLLEHEKVGIWSFFFGLVLVSALLVVNQIKKWSPLVVVVLLVGGGIAYFITEAQVMSLSPNLFFVFLSGAIAICAMILPGISGSFILLILGMYGYIMQSLKALDLLVAGTFAMGCLVGILSFSRVVSWLLKTYHDVAVALLCGFMLGSLNKLWPWKVVTKWRISESSGEKKPFLTENVQPEVYAQETGEPAQVFLAVGIMLAAIVVIFFVDRMAARRQAQ